LPNCERAVTDLQSVDASIAVAVRVEHTSQFHPETSEERLSMKANIARKRTPRANILRIRLFAVAALLTVVSIATLAGVFTAYGQNGRAYFYPGNLVVTRSLYVDTGSITAGVTVLPPNCSPANCPTPTTAVVSSAYPYVFNNDTVDGNFGITSKILLDKSNPAGMLVTSLEVPNSTQNGVPPTKDQVVTSFSSKSELALNLSTDGRDVSFMGYLAPVDSLDVSNSNTPAVIDPTNPVPGADYRVVADVD